MAIVDPPVRERIDQTLTAAFSVARP